MIIFHAYYSFYIINYTAIFQLNALTHIYLRFLPFNSLFPLLFSRKYFISSLVPSFILNFAYLCLTTTVFYFLIFQFMKYQFTLVYFVTYSIYFLAIQVCFVCFLFLSIYHSFPYNIPHSFPSRYLSFYPFLFFSLPSFLFLFPQNLGE